MPAFEHQHTFASARKIRRVNEPIVSAANDDDVVFVSHALFGIALAEDSLAYL
jgi:hypothetical protein